MECQKRIGRARRTCGPVLVGDLTVSKTGGSIITAFNSAARRQARRQINAFGSGCAAVSTEPTTSLLYVTVAAAGGPFQAWVALL
jgi:hypothetical protein